nr:MAG: ATP-dependent dethiobiotin synthetase BioD [Hyphomicrobiales bacterium]
MVKKLIITGTDTNIGKSVVAAMLTLCLDGIYWKPIQAGSKDGTDTERVAEMTGLGLEHFRPEAYVLTNPLSPHRAAELDGVTIDESRLQLPSDIPDARTLIIEGAGGVLVPITREKLQAELFAHWAGPTILCAWTELGTINHSLLSIEALRKRGVDVLGITFVGEEMADSENTIVTMGRTKHLGRMPILADISPRTLRAVFTTNFRRQDFESARAG